MESKNIFAPEFNFIYIFSTMLTLVALHFTRHNLISGSVCCSLELARSLAETFWNLILMFDVAVFLKIFLAFQGNIPSFTRDEKSSFCPFYFSDFQISGIKFVLPNFNFFLLQFSVFLSLSQKKKRSWLPYVFLFISILLHFVLLPDFLSPM